MPQIRVGPGVFIEENSNSSNSNASSEYLNLSNSNSNSSNSNSNESIRLPKQNVSRPYTVGFQTRRRVRHIPSLGKSQPVHRHSTTRKRLNHIPNQSKESSVKAAAARLLANAHKKSNTYNEMLKFIKKASGPLNVKKAALMRLSSRYRNFNLPSG